MSIDLTVKELDGIDLSFISKEDLEKNISSFITIVEEMVKQNPNDYDLGSTVRKFYLHYKK